MRTSQKRSHFIVNSYALVFFLSHSLFLDSPCHTILPFLMLHFTVYIICSVLSFSSFVFMCHSTHMYKIADHSFREIRDFIHAKIILDMNAYTMYFTSGFSKLNTSTPYFTTRATEKKYRLLVKSVNDALIFDI